MSIYPKLRGVALLLLLSHREFLASATASSGSFVCIFHIYKFVLNTYTHPHPHSPRNDAVPDATRECRRQHAVACHTKTTITSQQQQQQQQAFKTHLCWSCCWCSLCSSGARLSAQQPHKHSHTRTQTHTCLWLRHRHMAYAEHVCCVALTWRLLVD